jgi:hypothetical protein
MARANGLEAGKLTPGGWSSEGGRPSDPKSPDAQHTVVAWWRASSSARWIAHIRFPFHSDSRPPQLIDSTVGALRPPFTRVSRAPEPPRAAWIAEYHPAGVSGANHISISASGQSAPAISMSIVVSSVSKAVCTSLP